MTSRRPNITRVFTNDDPFRLVSPPNVPHLVDLLRAHAPSASLACASGSKLFHVACDKDPMGLDIDILPLPPQLPPAVDKAASFILRPPGPYSADQARARFALARLLAYNRDAEAGGTRAPRGRARPPRRPRGRQFYLGVGLVETHAFDQRVCHAEVVPHAARRPAASAPPSRGTERLPPLVTHPNFDFWRPVATEAEQRRAMGLYYGCAAHVDATLGALLGALEAMPALSQRTAVLVQGDHGYSLGRHGRWSKYNAYDEAARVPLLMTVPGGASGVVVDEVVESLDVLPTLLDLWGVPAVAAAADTSSRGGGGGGGGGGSTYVVGRGSHVTLDGRSLRHHLDAKSPARGAPRRPRAPARPYARTELHLPRGLGCSVLNQPYDGQPPGYASAPRVGPIAHLRLRSRRWAFIATFRGTLAAPAAPPVRLIDEALFDMAADPFEQANLAYYPAFAAVRGRFLRAVLREWGVRVDGPLNQTRWQRAEWLRHLTGFRKNWWK